MARYGFAFFDSGVRYDAPNNIRPTNMRDLHVFFEVAFDATSIALVRLFAFTTDHLQRMIANNPGGQLTARITATQSSLQLVFNCASDDETKLGLRMARKQAKDEFKTSLPEKVARVAAVVVAKYGPNAPEVTECFPQGRTIFSKSTDDAMGEHLQTMINGITAHQADLGAQAVADATAVLTGWNAVYSASEGSSGAKTSTEGAKKAARENLQLMLHLNLLTLAMMFPRQPEKLEVYMRQSLLENHPPQPPAPPTPPPGP